MADEDLILSLIERRSGNALREGADDLDRVGDSADHAGGSFRKLGDDSGFVDSEILRLKTHIKDLSTEIDRTGNKTLFKDIKTDTSQLRQFQNLAKVLGNVGEQGGKEFNKGFLATLGELGGNLRGAMIPVAIGLAALFAPIIGGAVAGAVVGAVGLGGIAGGVAAAAQDPKVKAAASVFGSEIAREFAMTGSAFVEPVIESLAILERAFRDLDLDEVFAEAAPHVTKLAEALAGMATSAMPGINRALAQLGPVMDVLAEDLPVVGKAFGDMIGDISESEGALDGLRFILEGTALLMDGLGQTIAALGNAFHWMGLRAAEFAGAMEDVIGWVPILGERIKSMNDLWESITDTGPEIATAWAPIPGRFNEVADAEQKALGAAAELKLASDAAALAAKAESDALIQLKRSLDDAFNATMSLDQAKLAIARDELAFKQAIDGGSKSLSFNTKEGQTNRGMILGLVQDYQRHREASSTTRAETEKATAKFHAQVGALQALATKAGFSKSEIQKLLGPYMALSRAPNINKTITFHIATTGSVPSVVGNVGKIASFDTGGWVTGPVGAPQLAVVHGGEFVVSHDMMKGGGSALPARSSAPVGGGGPTTIILDIRADDEEQARRIRKQVQVLGGGNVQLAYGKN